MTEEAAPRKIVRKGTFLSDEEAKDAVDKTGLFVEAGPSQLPIVFHPSYDVSFFGMERCHPFDAAKWGKVHGFLLSDGLLSSKAASVRPREASKADLRVHHSKEYLASLKWSARVAAIMEVPPVACLPNPVVQWRALKPFRLQTGGTVAAAGLAVERGWAVNVGGGFHHCSATRGGGFCAYADISLALRFLLLSGRIKRALIVDVDAHQGNGHARDFADDPAVRVLDLYNPAIYPQDRKARQGIDYEVLVRSRTGDSEYLRLLGEALPRALNETRPDLLLYNAGTDSMAGDPLGCLNLSPEGIAMRDEAVWRAAAERSVPLAMVTSGGYQRTNARVIADSLLRLSAKGLMPRDKPKIE